MALDLIDRANTAAFLERLLRLDPAALVRLRPAASAPGAARLTLFALLPWAVLVSRTVDGRISDDRTFAAADLARFAGDLDAAEPVRRDAQWRNPLPPTSLRAVERLPSAVVRQVAAAAAQALREAETAGVRGKAVGQRALRDALLDHPVVTGRSDLDGASFVVPQRLVQAVVRMGFLASDDEFVTVGVAGPWTALAASFGTAWFRESAGLAMRPIRN